jgi:hypothetical protein
MWRRRPTSQDIDQPPGAAQIDCAMKPLMGGRMDHTLGALQHRFEPLSGSKINAGTPAC